MVFGILCGLGHVKSRLTWVSSKPNTEAPTLMQVVNLGSDSRKLRGGEESEGAKTMKGILMSATLMGSSASSCGDLLRNHVEHACHCAWTNCPPSWQANSGLRERGVGHQQYWLQFPPSHFSINQLIKEFDLTGMYPVLEVIPSIDSLSEFSRHTWKREDTAYRRLREELGPEKERKRTRIWTGSQK